VTANSLEPGGLARAFDTPASKRQYVRQLFGTIAPRYDLITRLLSFGRDQRWKRRLMAEAGIKPGVRVLDLACGTGDLALQARARGAEVVALDLALPMLRQCRTKQMPGPSPEPDRDGRHLFLVAGDMAALPLPSGLFDVVTTGYGLRNVSELSAALAEIHRVLVPGGRLCALDFDRPEAPWLRAVLLTYLAGVGSGLGWLLHRNPDAYRYIPASIRRYPGARGVAAMLTGAGFRHVQHQPVLGGLMAMHIARK
jgi:demethylmenaquinone methyltransferase/2-methoxy-6-polyprenyl-1,4-benzoquinol methylase